MVFTSVASEPGFVDRFRAAWRGEEALAWVFWSYYVLVGIGLTCIHIAGLMVLSSLTDGDVAQFSGTPLGQSYALLADLIQLGYSGVAFILFVRCISNVGWRGWQYAGMLYMLGIAYQVVERARDISTVILGG